MLLALCSSLAVGWTALGPPPCAFRRTAAPIAAAEWEDCAGCKLLRPPGEPRALVHFLGGVFVSPAPQVAYRYLLEQLADRGYLVVATPYAVDFDYTKPADDVKRKLDAARAALAAESSAELPLVSLGHSLGALMQTLLACTYADYADACAGSVLVSWNNKPVSDAIPLFEQLFVPALGPLNGPLEQAVAAVAPGSDLAEMRRSNFDFVREQLAAPLGQQLESIFGRNRSPPS